MRVRLRASDRASSRPLSWRRRLRHPVWLGTARRLTPFSETWGFDRGTPVDRYYIERFLSEHRSDVRGRVLEVGDPRYTRRFGTAITSPDVLDVDPGNPEATVVADVARPEAFEPEAYDCFILAQTLQYVFDVRAAVRSAQRLLRPGGVVLATVPAVSRVARSAGVDGEFWRFTEASCRALFGGEFAPERVEVLAYGNVLTAVSFLLGLACEDLSPRELDHADPWFPVLIAVRAVKSP